MNNPIIKNGLFSAILLIALGLFAYVVLGTNDPENFKIGEVVGYSSIVLAMIFVFLGIKQYRDEENGGYISFWKAIGVGSGIALFPSVAFGLYNFIYSEFIDPEFSEKYFNYSIEQAKASMPAPEFEAHKALMESQMASFDNPFFQFFVMFMTVLIIGFIVSFISAFILKRAQEA